MNISTAITSVSWIPSEAITGHVRVPMDLGLGHYDNPPPDHLDDVAALAAAGAFRFANELHVTADVTDGVIGDVHQSGRSHICPTDLSVGGRTFQFAPVAFPDLESEVERHPDRVILRRTAGGRTGAPMPRRINRSPFVMLTAPTAWTTLEITIHADGGTESRLAGASPFPRHWIYGDDGDLVGKSATVDFATWSRENFDEKTPWEGHDEDTFVTAVESALERDLSLQIMQTGRRPSLRRITAGEELTRQGDPGAEVFLLLDGVVLVEVDGRELAQLGPGAVVGERALLEGGIRTATLRAVTDGKVAVAAEDDLDRDRLMALSAGHRREEESV
jgi:hypothetical protein